MGDEVRVLAVGTDIDLATKSVNWDEEYNVKDFDWIFLDFYSLDNMVGDSTISDTLESSLIIPSKKDIFKSIANGNRFVVFLPNREYIPKTSQFRFTFNKLTFANLNIVGESGMSVDQSTIDSNWSWYFDSNFEWNVRLKRTEPELFEIFGGKYIYEFSGIAQNNSGELLACDVIFHEVIDPDVPSHQPKTNQLPGKLSLIPVIKNWNTNELARDILDEFTDLNTRIKTDKSPNWISDWTLPEEPEIRNRLENLREKKTEIESTIRSTKEELAEYEQYKALLWGNEGELEMLVPKVFREMGFEVEGEVPHGRDGMIRLDDLNIVIEITGTKNSISDDKCRQLSTWVDEAEIEETGRDHTGMLIANPVREVRPTNRSKNDCLPPHLQDFLSKRDFKVLLTHNLFKLYSEFRDGNTAKDEIEAMLKNDALFVYK